MIPLTKRRDLRKLFQIPIGWYLPPSSVSIKRCLQFSKLWSQVQPEHVVILDMEPDYFRGDDLHSTIATTF